MSSKKGSVGPLVTMLQYFNELPRTHRGDIPRALLPLVVLLEHRRLAVFGHVFTKYSENCVALSTNLHTYHVEVFECAWCEAICAKDARLSHRLAGGVVAQKLGRACPAPFARGQRPGHVDGCPYRMCTGSI
jgi:hypothetical protein